MPEPVNSGEDLAFAIALAARAGEILMDRYERLERIDRKSARDRDHRRSHAHLLPKIFAHVYRKSDSRLAAHMDFKLSGLIGSLRSRTPVAAKTALSTAGAKADVPGSPMPPGFSLLLTTSTSTTGASWRRSIR